MATCSKDRPVMPGSFSPDDYIELYDNPFETLHELQTSFRDREPQVPWSAKNLGEVPIGSIDWHQFDPPSALRKTPNVKNQILLDIIWTSIENVKAEIAEEDRVKLEAEERKREEDDSNKPDKGKGKEAYLPIIISDEEVRLHDVKGKALALVEAPGDFPFPQPDITLESRMDGATKVQKRRNFAFRRIFQRNHEKGESSVAGSAREALRQLYETKQHNDNHEGTKRNSGHSSFLSRVNPLKSTPEEPVECVSCLDDFHPKEVVKVTCHSYCKDCFVRLVTAACQNEQQWPPKCCLNPIPFKIVLRYIPSDLKETFHNRSQEWEIPVSERIYCNQAECSLWLRPKNIDHAARVGRCENGHSTCTICRAESHDGVDCPEDNDMALTNLLAEEEGWRRCYNCNALVEHKEACQHMTCRCGSHFCYVCGLVWRTCQCTMEQLADVKNKAEERREQRRFKEQAEAEELRQILLQIEEFEREEALKAELLRQEQERLEEERRQRELEERVRQESVRRQDMEAKYKELRKMLDQLHELQMVMVSEKNREGWDALCAENEAKQKELEKDHETQRSDLSSLAMTKMADKEFALEKEYQIRAAEENDIEEAYCEKLKEFWTDKKDGNEEIEAAMLELRRRMDQGQRAWQKWKSEEIAAFQAHLDEERTYREEIMHSAMCRLKDSNAEKKVMHSRREIAERMWLHVVIVEREKLLSESEVQEVEGDADSLFVAESEENPWVAEETAAAS